MRGRQEHRPELGAGLHPKQWRFWQNVYVSESYSRYWEGAHAVGDPQERGLLGRAPPEQPAQLVQPITPLLPQLVQLPQHRFPIHRPSEGGLHQHSLHALQHPREPAGELPALVLREVQSVEGSEHGVAEGPESHPEELEVASVRRQLLGTGPFDEVAEVAEDAALHVQPGGLGEGAVPPQVLVERDLVQEQQLDPVRSAGDSLGDPVQARA